MEMGIVQCHRRGGELGILELPYPLLETFDVLPQQLSPGLALPIVILASVWFLCTDTLLASRLEAITSLQGCERKLMSDMEDTDHFSFSGQCVFKHDSSWISIIAGDWKYLQRRQAFPRCRVGGGVADSLLAIMGTVLNIHEGENLGDYDQSRG